MQTLTKNQQLLAKVISKQPYKPVLSTIYFDGIKAVATDSFNLIEITNGSDIVGAPTLINPKSFEPTSIATHDEFPNYEQLFDGSKNHESDYITITLNAKYLANTMAILSKINPVSHEIKMRVHKSDPLKFLEFIAINTATKENARALLATINKK